MNVKLQNQKNQKNIVALCLANNYLDKLNYTLFMYKEYTEIITAKIDDVCTSLLALANFWLTTCLFFHFGEKENNIS